MARRRAQLALDDQVCFALYSAFHAVMRTYRGLLSDAGLTYPQYLVMLALWERQPAAVAVGELGGRLHLDTGTLSPLLKRLEAGGFVSRRRDRDDERRVLVALTADGRALQDRVAGVPAALAACVGGGLADPVRLRSELHDLARTLDGPGDRRRAG